MSLLENFNNAISKSKVKGANSEAGFDVMYPTGFLALDMLNGQRIYVQSKDRNFSYVSAGIVDGSTNCFIGRSGCGKSTLCIQIAANIILPFIRAGYDANLFIDDIEGGLPQSRREFLLGMNLEELDNHVTIRNTEITTENILERITIIANNKLENKKEYTYDTGLFDSYGNRIFKLVPTVYVIDSLAVLMPEDITEKEDLGTNATGMSVAKQNTMFIKKVNQLCKSANIILLTINHILPRPQLGFLPTQSQLDGLSTDERLSGAQTVVYLCNNIFRLDDKTTLKDSEGYGINGKVVDIKMIKSRTNATRRSISLIFNKSQGYFDNILSLLHISKQEGKLTGVGATTRFEDLPDIKFSLKNFKSVLENSQELQEMLAKESYNILNPLLSDTKIQTAEKTITNSMTDMISKMGIIEY